MNDPSSDLNRTVTVADLDALVIDYFDKLKEKEEFEEIVTRCNIQIASIEAKLVNYLKALNRMDYKHPRGTIAYDIKWRVNGPQTDDDKRALFAWLKEQGIYDKYATVNVQSLNSLYFAEMGAAVREDPEAAITFSIPGIGERKMFEKLSKRKGKES